VAIIAENAVSSRAKTFSSVSTADTVGATAPGAESMTPTEPADVSTLGVRRSPPHATTADVMARKPSARTFTEYGMGIPRVLVIHDPLRLGASIQRAR
jgi:hypothetical protein